VHDNEGYGATSPIAELSANENCNATPITSCETYSGDEVVAQTEQLHAWKQPVAVEILLQLHNLVVVVVIIPRHAQQREF